MQITIGWSLILTALAIQVPSMSIAAETSQPESAIVKTAGAYLQAVLARDVEAVGATYMENAVEMPPCRPPLMGRAAIEQYYRQFFQGPVKVTEFTFSHLETKAAGSVGYTAGTYRQKLAGVPGSPIEDAGKFVVIVKHDSGAWKAAYVIYNSDRPPAGPSSAAAALPFPQPGVSPLPVNFAELSYQYLVRLGFLALGAASLAGIALLIRALLRRGPHWGSLRARLLERAATDTQV